MLLRCLFVASEFFFCMFHVPFYRYPVYMTCMFVGLSRISVQADFVQISQIMSLKLAHLTLLLAFTDDVAIVRCNPNFSALSPILVICSMHYLPQKSKKSLKVGIR